jgi:hypothetical protein
MVDVDPECYGIQQHIENPGKNEREIGELQTQKPA